MWMCCRSLYDIQSFHHVLGRYVPAPAVGPPCVQWQYPPPPLFLSVCQHRLGLRWAAPVTVAAIRKKQEPVDRDADFYNNKKNCFLQRCKPLLWWHHGHDRLSPILNNEILLVLCYSLRPFCKFWQWLSLFSSSQFGPIIVFSLCIRRCLSFTRHILTVLLFSQGTFVFSVARYSPLKFSNSYVYPLWANIMGWFIATISLSLIPLFVVYKVMQRKGSLKQVSMSSLWDE